MLLGLLLVHAGAAPRAAELTPAEVRQISRFATVAGFRDVPEEARARTQAEVERSYREAQALFPGRGADVAQYFLGHAGSPPANSAYFFALEALADTPTAILLIHALWAPFAPAPGGPRNAPVRDMFEIEVAIEAVLVNDAVRRDARTVAALVEAVARLRGVPNRHAVGIAVGLLGRCAGPDAVAALRRLASDRDASIRRFALAALGRAASVAALPGKAAPTSALDPLVRALRSDAGEGARAEAARSLGRLGAPEGAAALREALAAERNPQVIDAIVLALQRLSAPLTDPARCRELAGRTWDPQAGRILFRCWRATASPAALIGAATAGTPQLRALALDSVAGEAARPAPFPMPAIAMPPSPPPVGPPGAKSIAGSALPPREPAPQRTLDEATRDRLLASAVEVLSRPAAALPGAPGAISYGTVRLAHDALWRISGRNMAIALRYADRIRGADGRFLAPERFGASYTLWHKDRAAYAEYRRPRQALLAAALAAVFGLLLFPARTRRAAAALVAAALAWGASTLSATDVRDLPPPPLQVLTVTALACLAAAASVIALAVLWKSRGPETMGKSLARALASVPLAAVLAFFACGLTRWGGLFPVGGEGWELIFDPAASALVAAIAAAALGLLDALLFRRLAPDKLA